MFSSKKYCERRAGLRPLVKNGVILIPGNQEAPCNYKDNTYRFRQDSSFSYFFGIDEPNLLGVIDLDENREYIVGTDLEIDDIVWMGPQPSMKEKADLIGVGDVLTPKGLKEFILKAISKHRVVHYTKPYRADQELQLRSLLEIASLEPSVELTKAIVKLRSVKDADEIADIEQMVDVAWQMHTTAMKIARPGTTEKKIAGVIEGIALSQANGVSFPIILSMNGETLHNHKHGNVLEKGRLMVTDAGAESDLLYASDITRTVPVGGKFDERQKDVYNIVLRANLKAIELLSPDRPYLEVHLAVARVITEGMIDLGLMKGNAGDIVKEGAHALFFPHGLGHMMGLDVHDMENLGENYVGYDETVSRSTQFGLAYLRFAKKPLPGYVLTDEPGIYFIPALIDLWKSEKKFTEFINYDKLESYKNFGGIRMEDDLLVTPDGCRLLGKPIPKTVEEIENTMA